MQLLVAQAPKRASAESRPSSPTCSMKRFPSQMNRHYELKFAADVHASRRRRSSALSRCCRFAPRSLPRVVSRRRLHELPLCIEQRRRLDPEPILHRIYEVENIIHRIRLDPSPPDKPSRARSRPPRTQRASCWISSMRGSLSEEKLARDQQRTLDSPREQAPPIGERTTPHKAERAPYKNPIPSRHRIDAGLRTVGQVGRRCRRRRPRQPRPRSVDGLGGAGCSFEPHIQASTPPAVRMRTFWHRRGHSPA